MNIIRGSQPVRNYIAEKTHRGTMHLTRPPCKSLAVIHNKYLSRPEKEVTIRFGQYFCNNYVKKFDTVTDTFFNMGYEKSAEAINEWLYDNGYADTTPPNNNE